MYIVWRVLSAVNWAQTRLAQPRCYLIPCVNMHHISIITSNSHFCHHQYHHLLLVMVISSTSLYYISLLSYIQTYISLLTDIQIWKTKAIIIFFLSSPFSIAIISGQCSNGVWGSNNAQVSCRIVPRRPSWFYEISCIAVIRGWGRWIYAGDLHYCSAQTPSSSSDTSRQLAPNCRAL